ncbi:hypothetical protein E2C01_033424 [Portunus trituberculatus]|uniref:Uncharacterized protein n=1 Tax=Portunus trituberculatus TaxID=210409 RepID=A0A5B7F457_PORTR|nr:hypothetical protein [Portunus trituberculatus]
MDESSVNIEQVERANWSALTGVRIVKTRMEWRKGMNKTPSLKMTENPISLCPVVYPYQACLADCPSNVFTHLARYERRLARPHRALVTMPLPKKFVLRKRENIRKAREAFFKQKSGKNTSGKPSTSTASSTPSTSSSTPATRAQKRNRVSKEGEKPKDEVSDEYILVKKSDIEKTRKGTVCSECFGVLSVTYIHHQADVCVTVRCDNCNTVLLDNTALKQF